MMRLILSIVGVIAITAIIAFILLPHFSNQLVKPIADILKLSGHDSSEFVAAIIALEICLILLILMSLSTVIVKKWELIVWTTSCAAGSAIGIALGSFTASLMSSLSEGLAEFAFLFFWVGLFLMNKKITQPLKEIYGESCHKSTGHYLADWKIYSVLVIEYFLVFFILVVARIFFPI